MNVLATSPRGAGALCCTALLFAFFSSALAADAGHTDPAKVLVKVSGDAVTAGDILRRIRSEKGVDVDPASLGSAAWQRLVEEAAEKEIADLLLWQAARAGGVAVPPEKVEAALARSRQVMGEEKFRAMLRQRGAGEAEYREFLARRLAIEEYRARLVAGVEITDERVRDYYDGHLERFRIPDSVRVELMILEDEEAAREIVGKLEAGGDFTALAREHSVGYDRGVGGPTRWLPYEALPSDVAPLAREAPKGAVLEPIVSADQVHLMRVLDKREAGLLAYEEVREEIAGFLRRGEEEKILEAWLERKKEEAKIEYPR